MSQLDELLQRIEGLDPKVKKALLKETDKAFGGMKWIPTAGPQAQAYYSKADILGFGGQGGGGKTDLLLGLAFTAHERSLIVRRRYTDLSAILERAIDINGTRKGYSGQPPQTLRTPDGRLIEFGACAVPGDEEAWMGRPHDALLVDEATHFLESQIRFLMGWVRSTKKGQRTRVVLGTNPPMTAEGQWFFDMFRPWVDPAYPNPPKPGELLWYVTDERGKDRLVGGPEPVEIDGRKLLPLSRTFIPAGLKDNPFLTRTDEYQKRLDALPEPLRSAVRDGNFGATRQDDQWQLIPSAWIAAAQKRWTPKPPDVPMCAMGVDVAQGGAAETVLSPRYDGWFAPLVCVPGNETPLGTDVAALVVKNRRNQAEVIIDMGGGWGGAAMEHMTANGIPVKGYRGAEASSAKTRDRQLGFANRRAEAWWRFREALDPDQDGGSPIALPSDNQLFGDLVAPTFEVGARGVKMETKEDIVKRLGRSPDRGDAVVMAWSHGPTTMSHGQKWRKALKTFSQPAVLHGHDMQRRLLRRH